MFFFLGKVVIDQWIFGAPYFQTDPIEVKEWELSGKHSDHDFHTIPETSSITKGYQYVVRIVISLMILSSEQRGPSLITNVTLPL